MAKSRIILLTGEAEAGPLAAILSAAEDRTDVATAITLGHLRELMARPAAGSRLVAFCSSVIVPADVLAELGGNAYNFHPGPPECPGRYPSVFALYAGAPRFGITVHQMAPKVDSGPIVAADWFDMPPDCDLARLEQLTFIALADKFRALAPLLVRTDTPLPRAPYRWSGRKTTKADCEALCRITPDLSADEIARRRRACGAFITTAHTKFHDE